MGTLNFSQVLFQLDENVSKDQGLFGAFLNQSRMSTFMQDNPWETLTYSQKYAGIKPLGGDISPNAPPGYQPGNILKSYSPPAQQLLSSPQVNSNQTQPIQVNGLFLPKLFQANLKQ